MRFRPPQQAGFPGQRALAAFWLEPHRPWQRARGNNHPFVRRQLLSHRHLNELIERDAFGFGNLTDLIKQTLEQMFEAVANPRIAELNLAFPDVARRYLIKEARKNYQAQIDKQAREGGAINCHMCIKVARAA
jgi:hypothetical protein